MPLKPGELAVGVARKSRTKVSATHRIIQVLNETLEALPNELPAEVLTAFRSYRNLAKWKDETRGIEPMAENTLRKNLEVLFPGGLRGFDAARQKLFRTADTPPVKPGTKAAYQRDAGERREENKTLTNHILAFSAQYLDILAKTTNLAGSNTVLREEIKAHLKAYPNAYRGLRVVKGTSEGE
jgi:hypothetical protein